MVNDLTPYDFFLLTKIHNKEGDRRKVQRIDHLFLVPYVLEGKSN